jgi:hypothetical protein
MMGKGSKPGGTFDSGDSIERIVGRLRRRLQTHPEIRDAVSPIFENGELRRKALCWEEAASKLTTLFESNPTSDGMDVELFFLHLCVIGLARRRQLLKGLSDLGPCGTAAWSRDAGWTRKARSLWAGSHVSDRATASLMWWRRSGMLGPGGSEHAAPRTITGSYGFR